MDSDTSALRSIAQAYFDAAYEMDAEKFAPLFHPSSSVTRIGDDGNVSVTPIATWLAAVRNIPAPKDQGFERDDRILSIDVEKELAVLKVTLQVPPRVFTDMLSCLKYVVAAVLGWAVASRFSNDIPAVDLLIKSVIVFAVYFALLYLLDRRVRKVVGWAISWSQA